MSELPTLPRSFCHAAMNDFWITDLQQDVMVKLSYVKNFQQCSG